MRRTLAIGVALLALAAAVVSASAQGKMDCGAAYKGFLAKYQAKSATATAEQLTNAHRTALRAYDACVAGDEFNAKKFFDTLDAEAR